jgi:hypothetical protein
MSCGCSSTSDAYLACAGATPIFSEAQVAQYANRVGGQGGTGNWVYCYVVACLRVNRIIYWKQSPGDCTGGTSGVYSPSATTQVGAGVTGALSKLASADKEPITGAILSVASQVFNIFGQAHAQAVATEQGDLCQAFIDYNSFASQVEAGIAQGALGIQDAIVALNGVVNQVIARVETIEKPVNAAYGVHKALSALALFNKEMIYPSLVPVLPTLTATINTVPGLSTVQQAIAQIPGVSAVPGGSSTVLLIILALLGWKLLTPRQVA